MFKKITAIMALCLAFNSPLWAHGVSVYKTYLNTLNNSGVHGVARVVLKGNRLTVSIQAEGVEAGKPHPQHIHGFADDSAASCPDLSADTDGDHLVSVGEGVPVFGPIILPLQPFQTAEDGTINYQEEFMLGEDVAVTVDDVEPLGKRTIVLHGLTIDGTYVPTMPVACGRLAQQRGWAK